MKGKNKMRNTLILITIAFASIGNTLMADGWGQKQTQRTIGGALGGGTVGGIIGHQGGKQKEGIIIGSILGMIIGNKSGQGADYREEQRQWEARQREMAHREELKRREQQRIEQARNKQFQYQQVQRVNNNTFGNTHSSDEITQARHRAEQREAELQRELEIRRIQEERRKALLEFQERERIAQEQLQRLRNGQHY
jgi:hypothetical protein